MHFTRTEVGSPHKRTCRAIEWLTRQGWTLHVREHSRLDARAVLHAVVRDVLICVKCRALGIRRSSPGEPRSRSHGSGRYQCAPIDGTFGPSPVIHGARRMYPWC